MDPIARSFQIKNVGRRIRKYIARCDACQRMKYPNKSYATQERSYLPGKRGDLCVMDLFGALLVARRGIKFTLVCYDVNYQTPVGRLEES